MKLKSFVRIRLGRISGGTTLVDDDPRADMFLPAWMFAMGSFFVLFGSILGTVSIALRLPLILILLEVFLVLVGFVALLCWKNQTIRMLSNDSFEYSTFLGNKTIYCFNEIEGVKYKNDSTTLFVGKGKVHIESIAIISDRLADRIDMQLKGLDSEQKKIR